MKNFLARADTVVRGELSLTDATAPSSRTWLQLLVLILFFGSLYGAVMGTFGGLGGDRLLQVFYSAVKVPSSTARHVRAQSAEFFYF